MASTGSVKYNAGDQIKLSDDETFYAVIETSTEPPAEEHTYTATFMYNGTASKTLSCTTTGTSCNVTAPNQEVTSGVFKGWSETSGGTVKYNVGATITLTSNKTFYAVVETTTTITENDIVLAGSNYTYTGNSITPKVTVKIGNTVLEKDRDYRVLYADNINAGTATVIVIGKGTYTGVAEKTYTIKPMTINSNNTRIKGIIDREYTGRNITHSITVINNNHLVTYDIVYKNNRNVGLAVIYIQGKGNYTGTIVKTFKIVPNKVTISSLTSKVKNKAIVKYRPKNTGTKYIIAYKKQGSNKWQYVYSTFSYRVLSRLQSKKIYSIRIRAVKEVMNQKYYSAWSAVKTVKIK